VNRIVGKLCTAEMLGITDTVSLALKEEAVKIFKKCTHDTELFYRVEFPSCVQSKVGYSDLF
jgi:hypothetical protein